jgi:hypothetical protein
MMATIGAPLRRIIVTPKVTPVPQPLEPMPAPPTVPERDKVKSMR